MFLLSTMFNSPIITEHLKRPSTPIAIGSDWKAYRVVVRGNSRQRTTIAVLTVYNDGSYDIETIDN